MKERMFKPDPTETAFTSWGTLVGAGIELRGKIKPLGTGRVRSFMHAQAKRAVFVSEFCFDEDRPVAQPGFDLIASTFRFR